MPQNNEYGSIVVVNGVTGFAHLIENNAKVLGTQNQQNAVALNIEMDGYDTVFTEPKGLYVRDVYGESTGDTKPYVKMQSVISNVPLEE